MIRTEILAQLGRQHLLIAPVRSEIDGVWRIKISTDEGRAVFLDSLTQLVGGLLAKPVAGERPVRRARQAAS